MRRLLIQLFVALLTISVFPGIQRALAADATVAPADLAAMARAAMDQVQPYPRERVAQTRERLQKAIEQLDRFLKTGTQKNAANWKKYLLWDEMLAELAKDKVPDLDQLGRIRARYCRNYTSLEHPRFTNVRDALYDYRAACGMSSYRDFTKNCKLRLEKLATLLKQYEQAPTMERAQAIGVLVEWLEMAAQADDLVAAIRGRYWQPNLYAAVSQHMVNSGLTMDVSETQDVHDCILGTTMIGTAEMQGRINVELVDSLDAAHIRLHLHGNIHSNTTGYNRGVKIFTQGETAVQGTKSVRIASSGISSEPAEVHCETDSTINGISARSCFVEKIAWKRARRSKSQGERVGAGLAEQRVAKGMDQRAKELLEQTRSEYQEKFLLPLQRRNEAPHQLKFTTENHQLKVRWQQVNASQLAAPNVPGPIDAGKDVAVQLHESFVTNFSRAMIGGLRLSDEKLAEILEKNFGKVPEALQLSDDKDPWAITFSSQKPVSATFQDNTIRFAIRGRKFELGERNVNRTLELSAVYKLEKTPEGARLIRQGDVSVDYIGGPKRLGFEETSVRSVMRKKFEALFAPEFETTGIELPGRWEKAGMLHLETLDADDGWLQLAWVLVDHAAKDVQ